MAGQSGVLRSANTIVPECQDDVPKRKHASATIYPKVSRRVIPDKAKSPGSRQTLRWISALQALILPTFWKTFGFISIPVLLVTLICIGWTTWLTIVTLAPNQTANFLMNTDEFDDGRFWMLLEQSTRMKVAVVSALVVINLGYLRGLFKVLRHRPSRRQSKIQAIEYHVDEWLKTQESQHLAGQIARATRSLLRSWRDLTSIRGRNRKFWNWLLKLGDLAMQTIALHQFMEKGAPLPLLQGYIAFVAFHSAFFALVTLLRRHTALEEIVIDSAFDLFSTIAVPILVLLYAYVNCHIDFESSRIYNELMPEGSFERSARMMADPHEIVLFRSSFDALRILSATDLFLRVGMNLFFCYRLNRMIEELERQRSRRAAVRVIVNQRPVPRIAALVFIAYGCAITVYASMSISASRAACSDYPQCVEFAYQLATNDGCPCLTLIDAERAPKTFDEWLNPPDVTDNVRVLAASGKLRTLQLVNRNLETLPEELRRCQHLESLYLSHTGTHELPPWMPTFQHLQYLQIDGRYGGPTLRELRDDLFDSFSSLIFLHISIHPELKRVPPLDGLTNLRSVAFARMFSMSTLPTFDHLPLIEHIAISYMPLVRTLPELGHLPHLMHFSLYRLSYACCDGFLGVCNLTHPFCAGIPSAGVPVTTCVDPETERASRETMATLDRFASSVCQPSMVDFASDFPNKARSDLCGGVLYRSCRVDNTTGMCYNSRVQVVACTTDANKIKVRKLQIVRGVGLACDPVEEEWLGCKP